MAELVMKKEWTEPELIVLVRSNPEEAVLTACKHDDVTGPKSSTAACIFLDGECETPTFS